MTGDPTINELLGSGVVRRGFVGACVVSPAALRAARRVAIIGRQLARAALAQDVPGFGFAQERPAEDRPSDARPTDAAEASA